MRGCGFLLIVSTCSSGNFTTHRIPPRYTGLGKPLRTSRPSKRRRYPVHPWLPTRIILLSLFEHCHRFAGQCGDCELLAGGGFSQNFCSAKSTDKGRASTTSFDVSQMDHEVPLPSFSSTTASHFASQRLLTARLRVHVRRMALRVARARRTGTGCLRTTWWSRFRPSLYSWR